jgi:hypothetical protein
VTPSELPREKYGLPHGPKDPNYSFCKWPASVAVAHFRGVAKALGRHVADLFAAGAQVEGSIPERVAKAAAAGYLGDLVDAASDYDWIAAVKRMAADARLMRREADGTMRPVYDFGDPKAAEADAQASTGGIELYYAGRVDELLRIWWALLVENTGPFARRLG